MPKVMRSKTWNELPVYNRLEDGAEFRRLSGLDFGSRLSRPGSEAWALMSIVPHG